jgi:hypothetical protein
MPVIVIPPGFYGYLDPLNKATAAGRIISGVTENVPERDGLGDVTSQWYDLRIWEEGPKIENTPSGSTARVPFKIPADRAPRLVSELLGWPYLSNLGLRRHRPEAYRNWMFEIAGMGDGAVPATAVMYCTRTMTSYTGQPKDYVSQNPDKTLPLGTYYPDPRYQWARVDAYFETLAMPVKLISELVEFPGQPYEMQRNVIKTEESNGRYLSYAYGDWQVWDGLGAKKDANFRNINFWEAYNTIKYEWMDVLPEAFNHTRNQGLQGKSNDKVFDGYPVGTLVLLKTNRLPRMTQLGQRCYAVTHEFLYVPTNVNKAKPPGPVDPINPYWWVVKKGTTDADFTGGGGAAGSGSYDKPYPAGDMDSLFKP